MNNWWGDLWYIIGAAALVWLAQLVALGFYLWKKRMQLRIAASNANKASAVDTITYDEGLALMGPVRNPNENRPV